MSNGVADVINYHLQNYNVINHCAEIQLSINLKWGGGAVVSAANSVLLIGSSLTVSTDDSPMQPPVQLAECKRKQYIVHEG